MFLSLVYIFYNLQVILKKVKIKCDRSNGRSTGNHIVGLVTNDACTINVFQKVTLGFVKDTTSFDHTQRQAKIKHT